MLFYVRNICQGQPPYIFNTPNLAPFVKSLDTSVLEKHADALSEAGGLGLGLGFGFHNNFILLCSSLTAHYCVYII